MDVHLRQSPWRPGARTFAIHSDAPVTPLSPLFTAWCAVNRLTSSGRLLGAAQRISVPEALHAITLGAATTLGPGPGDRLDRGRQAGRLRGAGKRSAGLRAAGPQGPAGVGRGAGRSAGGGCRRSRRTRRRPHCSTSSTYCEHRRAPPGRAQHGGGDQPADHGGGHSASGSWRRRRPSRWRSASNAGAHGQRGHDDGPRALCGRRPAVASVRPMPWSRRATIAYSTSRMEFFVATPISMISPISEGIEKLMRAQHQADEGAAQRTAAAPTGWWPAAGSP